MNLIDAHAHVFDQLSGFGADGELRAIGNGRARWATGDVIDLIPPGYGDTAFTAEALLRLMDENAVEKAVLLQGGFLGFQNDYLHETHRKYPDRFAVAATFDPFCRNAGKILNHLFEDLRFTIFKFEMSTGCGIMGNHPDFPLDADWLMPFYERIAAMGGILVFDLGSPGDGSNQPEAIARIAEQFPTTQIVVCHLMSPRRNHRVELEHGLEVMKRETIHFDLSALHWKVRPESYPFPTAREFTKIAKDRVGFERLMWGSDAPSTLCHETFGYLVDYLLPEFTSSEAEKVFHDNALSLYFKS